MQKANPDHLFEYLLKNQADDQAKLPPVEQWNTPLSGDMDLRIARDGTWYHEGDPIKRQALVKLFSTILVREDDDYFLMTPVEKWRIQVEDAPFMATEVRVENPGNEQALVFNTNVGASVVAGEQNPVWVISDPESGEPSPYIRVRKNLNARINRSVFYQLAELAVENPAGNNKEMGVFSLGEFYSLEG